MERRRWTWWAAFLAFAVDECTSPASPWSEAFGVMRWQMPVSRPAAVQNSLAQVSALNGIAHVAIRVHDLAAAEAFTKSWASSKRLS